MVQYLVVHDVSVHMLNNYVSALKAMCILYNLPFNVFDHPKIKYFMKAVGINSPLRVPQKHTIYIPTLQRLISLVESFRDGITYKAMFLLSYFVFFPPAKSGSACN